MRFLAAPMLKNEVFKGNFYEVVFITTILYEANIVYFRNSLSAKNPFFSPIAH
jgi:hypothetical protein